MAVEFCQRSRVSLVAALKVLFDLVSLFCSWFLAVYLNLFLKVIARELLPLNLCSRINSKVIILELNIVEEEVSGPCANYRIGDDDLQPYDFIRQFRLDLLETQYRGVSKVRGSSRTQTAYRLEKEADVTVPTR